MQPALELRPGRVYRSRDFRAYTSNPSRLLAGLVREGSLEKLQGGLYAAPQRGRWGKVPVDLDRLLAKWLEGRRGRDWIYSGTPVWNALDLGSTTIQARTMVYNRKRSGRFDLGGHRLELRRVPFPTSPPPEWFVVDFLNHLDATDASEEVATERLARAFAAGRLDAERTTAFAEGYGRLHTQAAIDCARSRSLAKA